MARKRKSAKTAIKAKSTQSKATAEKPVVKNPPRPVGRMRTRNNSTQIDDVPITLVKPVTDKMLNDLTPQLPKEPVEIQDTQVADKDTETEGEKPPELPEHPQSQDLDEPESDLNSSPIKLNRYISPIRRSVAFSDDLISDTPDLRPPVNATPKKSILKLSPRKAERAPSFKTFNPEDASFWSNGVIVQLPPHSDNFLTLFNGCLAVLKDKQFKLRFEVYASLNYNMKINDLTSIVNQPFKSPKSPRSPKPPINRVSQLSALIQRDISDIERDIFNQEDDKENLPDKNHQDKSDPFSTRIISQSLKLMLLVINEPSLSELLSVDDIRWFYYHSSLMIIKPEISKALAISYLNILKETPFVPKRKRLIFDNPTIDIPEHMLFGLLNMKYFPSVSLQQEKLVALKNLVKQFPNTMTHNFNHWFPVFMNQMFTLTGAGYTKPFILSILVLMESSRVFLNNHNVGTMVNDYLEQMENDSSNFDCLIGILENLADSQKHKNALDIWFSITLMVKQRSGFDNWKFLARWLNVFKYCIPRETPEMAIKAWRAVVYNLCCDLDSGRKAMVLGKETANDKASDKVQLENKFDLLKTILHCTTSNTPETMDAFDGIILCMVYGLSRRTDSIYWDYLLQPVMEFYFTGNKPSIHGSNGTKLLIRLMKSNNETFDPSRYLSNDKLPITSIRPLDAGWIALNTTKFLPIMRLALQQDTRPEVKLSVITSFCEYLKGHKKVLSMVKPQLHQMMTGICHHDISTKSLVAPFACLINTYGVHELLQPDFISLFTNKLVQGNGDLDTLLGSLDRSKSLPIITRYFKLKGVDNTFGQRLELCKVNFTSPIELKECGELLKAFTDMNKFLKGIIQSLVLLKEPEFLQSVKTIDIVNWNIQNFKVYIALIKTSPFPYMLTNGCEMIQEKLERDPAVMDIFPILCDNNGIFRGTYKSFLARYETLDDGGKQEFKKCWKDYLDTVRREERWGDLDEMLCAGDLGESFDVSNLPRYGAKVELQQRLGMRGSEKEYEKGGEKGGEVIPESLEIPEVGALEIPDSMGSLEIPESLDLGAPIVPEMGVVPETVSQPGLDSDSDTPDNTFSSETGSNSDDDLSSPEKSNKRQAEEIFTVKRQRLMDMGSDSSDSVDESPCKKPEINHNEKVNRMMSLADELSHCELNGQQKNELELKLLQFLVSLKSS